MQTYVSSYPFLCVNQVPSSPGVVFDPELDDHRGAGRANDCDWFKRPFWRGSKGAAGEDSWLLHASGQLPPGHQEIHPGRQQAQGNLAWNILQELLHLVYMYNVMQYMHTQIHMQVEIWVFNPKNPFCFIS